MLQLFICFLMIKSFLSFIVILTLVSTQTITPQYILPVQTTQNVLTSYSLQFYTDTSIANNAIVAIKFPFEFSSNALTQVSRIRYTINESMPISVKWTLQNFYTFLIPINQIAIGNITVVIDNILNPSSHTSSSYFTVETRFKNVVITSNSQFGRVSFTSAPTTTTGGIVNNLVNTYIQQGSSWMFKFTLSATYPANSTLRFIFPEGFLSNKVQCNVSGNFANNMKTRVFPNKHVYDCLNLNRSLSGYLQVIVSGIVNPNFETTTSGFQVHVLQPNNLIVQEIVTSTSSVLIRNKPLNATVTTPNQYRNNSVTYVFQINTDTNLIDGDYFEFKITGLWKLLTDKISIISGLNMQLGKTPNWTSTISTAGPTTTLTLMNFTSILKSSQFAFYLPLVTPLAANTYVLTIKAFRANGKLAQSYSTNIIINQTTGYIREMKLHPMERAIKLPVGKTGPLEIVLFLQTNLPQTNVLTHGQINIKIRPKIPQPITNLNGVPKCYFYRNIPAKNCTFNSSAADHTMIIIFTPIDFNFQQSQVPLTITTQGYQLPENQGYTIDTLVKRYFFQIQFFSHTRPYPIPQQVLFDEWIPDSIPITSLTCTTMNTNAYQSDHIKCSFVTPNQTLNNNGFIHFFRLQFSSPNGSNVNMGWKFTANQITPDYPCLMYGTNVSAVPYVKCDLVTWTTGPYKSSQSGTSFSYITFYGLSTIPGGSTINFEIPNIYKDVWSRQTNVKLSILQDTPGFNSPIVYIYTQTLLTATTSASVPGYVLETPTIVLSNSIVNKVTSITLNSYSLSQTGVTQIILEVDQAAFPNIGRGNNIVCGTHLCSKFDKPIQYFILYPSTTLTATQTLVFPNILNPPYSGSFRFNLRAYKGQVTVKKAYFFVTITADTITDRSYKFSPIETITSLYPNSNHFYLVSWAHVNPLNSLNGLSYITITLDNIFTFGSTHCYLTTNAVAYDVRGIICQLSTGGTQLTLKNIQDTAVGAYFNLTIQLWSTSSANPVSPTVTIRTYYGNGAQVDRAINIPFAIASLPNSNFIVFNSFSVPPAFTSTRSFTQGYYGPLLISFQPYLSSTVVNGTNIILTTNNQFYPEGNALGRPLSCKINGKRFPCTYTLSPFKVTITGTNSQFTAGQNIINITTEYQNSNGIFYPITNGRKYLSLEIVNTTGVSQTLEKVQQYIDILPPDISYFNATWAHRDTNLANIFTFQIKNGPTAIPAYNQGTQQGRIYIGFPLKTPLGATVFTADLGFTNLFQGSILPCYFDVSNPSYVIAASGLKMQCKLRKSYLTDLYHTWIQIINFATIPAGAVLRVFIGKVLNPSSKQVDINFMLKVNTIAKSTNIQTMLYQSTFNMFFDMLTPSITLLNQQSPNELLFQPGSTIGQTNRYINITPYAQGGYNKNDWFILDLDTQFPLNGDIYNCQQPFYQYCIIYPTVNWLAIKIGNGTRLSVQPFISKLPISLSRIDTTFKSYNFLTGRWKETVTHTIGATTRWIELRGTITGFSLSVLGSQNNLNVGQKNVQILIAFTVSHEVPIGGSIQIKFPENATFVPAIKPHCRSAVSHSSALMGFNTGKPSVNVQGQVGCSVQNTYSWIITGFDKLNAGSQVKIYGLIDFPTVATNTLGMGFVVTYSTQDSSNTFNNGKTISYLTTNFPLTVQNLTWKTDPTFTLLKMAPLRVNHVGPFKFLLNLQTNLSPVSGGGYINLILHQNSITGQSGGFSGGQSSNRVCTIFNAATDQKYGCYVSKTTGPPSQAYITYQITTYQTIPANNDLEITITTQQGSPPQGIIYPTSVGKYRVQVQVEYSTNNVNDRSQAHYIECYGPTFTSIQFNSTITIPGQDNFIILSIIPSSNIAADEQLIIDIPTLSVTNELLFPEDLGVGYKNYDNLVFDIFESGITSMICKVFTGDTHTLTGNSVKIICSNFDIEITTSTTVKFGFWVKNPIVTKSVSIPVQVYSYNQKYGRKNNWMLIQPGIRLIPVTTTSIIDDGKWFFSGNARLSQNILVSFVARNSLTMSPNDWYILKFNYKFSTFGKFTNSFLYSTTFANTGDLFYLINCKTVLLRLGSNTLPAVASGSTTRNARFTNFINPAHQLTTAEGIISGYIVYNTLRDCEKVQYSDTFEATYANQPLSPYIRLQQNNAVNAVGQLSDYRITFSTTTNAASTQTKAVKLIAILFSQNTLQILGNLCMEDYRNSSSMQISDCTMDPATRTIWITPVYKPTQSDKRTFSIITFGNSFKNPLTTFNYNTLAVRYYTWPDGQQKPAISSSSDDWCFLIQDSTRLTGTKTFTTTNVSPLHNHFSLPHQNYINQFQPANYMIGNASTLLEAKSQFLFKMKCPASFPLQTGTNYHTISVEFSTYYEHPTLNQKVNDLFYYVPTCELNSFRIHVCTVSGGKITMSFLNQLTANSEIAVKFSIVNPFNMYDRGFTLKNTNKGIISLPIELKPFNSGSSTKYYAQPQPFHPFYRTTSNAAAYPSFGISDVTIVYGSQIQSQLNYVEFAITLTRNDIDGIIVQIPVVHENGNKIYDIPSLMGLKSGSRYPCSLGVYVDVFCYYEQGSTTNYGTPIRIFVTKFSIPGDNIIPLRLLITNPDLADVFPSFVFRAVGGGTNDNIGSQLRGIFTLVDAFKVYASNLYHSTGSCFCQPTKHLWQTTTNHHCYIGDQSHAAGGYAIFKIPLIDQTYGTIAEYDQNSNYDHFLWYQDVNKVSIYIVKKLTSNYVNSGSSYYEFGYIRFKHHLVNSYQIYLLGKSWSKLYTATVNNTWVRTNKCSGVYSMSIRNIDIQYRRSGDWGWHFFSIYTGNAHTMEFKSDQASQMVISIKVIDGKTYSSLNSSYTNCNIESGVVGSDPLSPVKCTVDVTNERFVITNVYKFTTDPLRIMYYARTASTQDNFDVEVHAFANLNAYNDYNWPIFYHTSDSNFNLEDMFYSSNPSYSVKTTSQNSFNSMTPSSTSGSHTATKIFASGVQHNSANVQIVSISSTQIKVRFTLNQYINFYDQTFRMGFRFYTPRLVVSSCSGVSVFYSNNVSPNYCVSGSCTTTFGQGSRSFFVNFYMYRNAYSMNQWRAWNSGEYYEFTFTFASVVEDSDANSNPDSLFITGTLIWQNARYHSSDNSKCGCTTNYYACNRNCYDAWSNWYRCCANTNFDDSCSVSTDCTTYCTANSCRYNYAWDYRVALSHSSGFNKPVTDVAATVSATFTSLRYTQETQLTISFTNLYAALTSTMISTTQTSNRQLIVSFTGNQVYSAPSQSRLSTGPFQWTRAGQEAATIDCMCVVSASTITMSSSLSYSAANCTRYMMAGYPPFIGIKVDANIGTNMQCFIPGFQMPNSTNGNRIYLNFYTESQNHFKFNNLPNQFFSYYQTLTVSPSDITISSTQNTGPNQATYNSTFWNSPLYTNQNRNFQFYFRATSTNTNSHLYMSSYYPVPVQSLCSSSSYLQCRAYNSYHTRRHYLSIQMNGFTNAMNISGSLNAPRSKDQLTQFYKTFVGWTPGTNRYYSNVWSQTATASVLQPKLIDFSITPSIFSNTLLNTYTTIVMRADVSGFKLYSNLKTKGMFAGSYIKITASTAVFNYDCGVAILNSLNPTLANNYLYCTVLSSTVLQIRSSAEITLSGIMQVTTYVQYVSSNTYTFILYDKYIDSSDYAIAAQNTVTITGRSISNIILVPQTSVKWRRQTYIKANINVSNKPSSAIRFTLNSNLQFVSAYNQTSHSESTTSSIGLQYYYEDAQFLNTDKYYCIVRQYPINKYSFYKEYTLRCQYKTNSYILIKSLPSHTRTPDFYYEFIIYYNKGSADNLFTFDNNNQRHMAFATSDYSSIASPFTNVLMRSTVYDHPYTAIYPFVLNSIYILTREASSVNSLFIDFTSTIASTQTYYIQFILQGLQLGNFNINNGDQIPCNLDTGWGQIGLKSNGPKCYGSSSIITQIQSITIRVVSAAAYSANTNLKISFDNFVNPPKKPLILIPINLRISLLDCSASVVTSYSTYTSYFPNIYYSDSVNVGVPAAVSSNNNVLRSNNYRGASTLHYWNINSWPYTSNTNDVSQKISFKLQGGITCCQTNNNLRFSDTDVYYDRLWVNNALNVSVYKMPTRNVGTTGKNFHINSVNNPQQVNRATYEKIRTATAILYNNYQAAYISSVSQPAFSSYTVNTDFIVKSDLGSAIQKAINVNSHSQYPITYEFHWDLLSSSYINRNISYIILYFTNGVRLIDQAWLRYETSPFYTNQFGYIKTGYDTTNRWYLNISGIMDSNTHSSFHWYARVRLYASSSTISYTSYVYNYDGYQQFNPTSGSRNTGSDSWSSSSQFGLPNKFYLNYKKYTKNYFELANTQIYAQTALTTNKLYFKFQSPYNMTEVETIQFISSSSSYPNPSPTSMALACIIQPATQLSTVFGFGYDTTCTFNSGAQAYTVKIPIGGLPNGEYLLTILGRKSETSIFNLPPTPTRIQISMIYKNNLNILYGDVFLLSFSGQMSSYSVSHAHLMRGEYDMLGFTFTSPFDFPAAVTSGSITQAVLQFEIESKYHDNCLGIASNYAADGMAFYSGVYYSHFSTPVSASALNANTRILCSPSTPTQALNWAPVKLTVTDYISITAASSHYFRFPLIKLPSDTNVPLTYKVKLVSYSSGDSRPTIISSFVYENLVRTNSASSTNTHAYFITTSNIVQNNVAVSFNYHSSYYNINIAGLQTIVKFENNAIPALTSIVALKTLSDASYDYQYYPNINLCLFRKLSNTNSYGFSLGTFPTSIDQQSLKISYVYTFTSLSHKRMAFFNSATNFAIATLAYGNSWTTTSFTRGTGILGVNSQDIYTISWSINNLAFPESSYIILTLSNIYTIMDQYCYSFTGFTQGTQSNSNLVCKRYGTNTILIAGYSSLSANAPLEIKLYLQIAPNNIGAYSSSVNIVVYSSAGNTIINANTVNLSFTTTITGPQSLALNNKMIRPYTKGNAFPLYIVFKLKSNTLVVGDYLQIDFGNWVIDTATTGQRIFKYQVSGNEYWVPSAATLVSGNIFQIPVYLNYSMIANNQITIWVDTFAPTSYYGARIVDHQWNTFKIFAFKSGVHVQQQIKRIWTEPYGHPSFVATPALTYVNAKTLWQFSVTPNASSISGDSIIIQFTTSDELQTTLFSNNLGATINIPNPGSFQCAEQYNTRIISDDVLKCRVYQGDNTKTPSIPTTIVIPITKSISANTLLKFNIMNLVNPSLANYPIGIVFKLANSCSNLDSINLCAYYKSVTYLTFQAAVSEGGYLSGIGSLTFNPTRVSANNTLHTISANYALSTGDFLKIKYYAQIPIPIVCTISSGSGVCYSYPLNNTIIIKVTAPITSPYSFTLSGMRNPTQQSYTNTFSTQRWSAGSIQVRFYTTYSVTHITIDPTTSTPLGITFTPTLTPNYQLKYQFKNIALVKISKLLQNLNIKHIRLNSPTGITLDTNYCNATVQTYAGQAKPYPFRLICSTMATNYILLLFQSDYPSWDPSFTQRDINIYLKYTIADATASPTGNWNAIAYGDLTLQTNMYRISQAFGNFPIDNYITPFLYVINFPTRSFDQRTCAVGKKCMIYGYIQPTTTSAQIPINRMTFLLPKQFNYSNQATFDACKIQSSTTTFSTFSCTVSRENSQVTISYSPGAYNQLYNLINIDHSDDSQLFIAPNYPGNHYQMKVNLWSTSGSNLVQSQFINLTTVYGYYLSVPNITFTIPKDGGSKGLFDLTFLVGSVDILPSYENSASNSITSAIQITFAHTFDASLGTSLPAGSEIACLAVSGLTFNTMSKITCRIYPQTSSITYPTIIVTGYDRISAASIVRIRFANLKTLPNDVTDYCTLGVSLTYFDYGKVKGYIYSPVSFVVGPPSATGTIKTITFTVTEAGSNRVGELSNYTFSGQIASGFSPITTNDFIVVQFPPYAFQSNFNLNAQALCTLAAANKCDIYGLANQIYIQPSSTISTSAFSFSINKILNAAYELEYVATQISIFTLVSNKVNARGSASFTKLSQASTNVSAIITSIDSIYGGDSGINYYFSFRLSSYLPATGKISIFFPTIFTSLFNVKSTCFLRSDSQLKVGSRAYCQIISTHQLVIVPNALLSASEAYYFTVTNITNPNVNLTNFRFRIQTYHFSDVYRPSIISKSTFASPILSIITIKQCKLQVDLTISNPNTPSQYKLNLVCFNQIKQASQLKLYLSWNPAITSTRCSAESSVLYSTDCKILTEYQGNTKLTYLSIYLRNIQANSIVSISGTITNGNQGTYALNYGINFNGFVYLNGTSNSFYVANPTTTTSGASVATSSTGVATSSSGNSISIRTTNYPLNRFFSATYTFAMTNFDVSSPILEIKVPDSIKASQAGITCNYRTWNTSDNYFNLLIDSNVNILECSYTNQRIIIDGLDKANKTLSSTGFLYIIINGLLNPQRSMSSQDFTFTFINSANKALAIYSLPLSYAIADPPTDIQINQIQLSNSKYFVISNYKFTVSTVKSTNTITIVKSTRLGLIIDFPPAYNQIWNQIPRPSSLNLTINGVTYTSTSIRLITGRLFSQFNDDIFTNQVIFTNLVIQFIFRNPNTSINCQIKPVFKVSLFDFKSNIISAQSLSNNQLCPSLTDRLFGINITGNTKISAGSSSTFTISLQKPSYYLAITPVSTSSAISFSPSTIVFSNFTSTLQNFTINVATGLNGSYNITFTKQEGTYTFYNDIQFTTINIYVPTYKYKITFGTFSLKSVGIPIEIPIYLQEVNPTQFYLVFTHNCTSNFIFNPTDRIRVADRVKIVIFTVAYNGNKIPPACALRFTMSSFTINSFILSNSVIYLSASVSIDRSSNTPPMILSLTTTPKNSTQVGRPIVTSTQQGSTSTANYYSKNPPTVYKVTSDTVGSNKAKFTAITSHTGRVYYVILKSGTPTAQIKQQQIYLKTVGSSIQFGNSIASLNVSGVNTLSNLEVSNLISSTNYIIGVYVNSTVGNSPIYFLEFKTSKTSNAAVIKLGFSSLTNSSRILEYMSLVLRIAKKRISLKTNQTKLANLANISDSSVMNARTYVYQIVVEPDIVNDLTKPFDLLTEFSKNANSLKMLKQFIPAFIVQYKMGITQIVVSKPVIRNPSRLVQSSYKNTIVNGSFWDISNVSAIIVKHPSSRPKSSQIIEGLDANNNKVVNQHKSNVITNDRGDFNVSFSLLDDDSNYTVYVTATALVTFEQKISLNDNQVMSVPLKTTVNLNLMKNKGRVVQEIKKINPELAKAVKQHIQRVDAINKVIGYDKTQKRRKHKGGN